MITQLKIKKAIERVDPKETYTVSAIIDTGLFDRGSPETTTRAIHRMFASGKLPYINTSTGKKYARYVVRGKDLIALAQEYYKVN